MRILWNAAPALLILFAVLLPAAVRAAPVVTAGNVSVDASGATGVAGTLVVGDEVVISWDNSASGDDNADVTELSQVTFDVFGIASLQADSLAGGVFSVTYFFSQGDGEWDDVSAGVTVTSPGGSTGPVYGLDTVDIDAQPPVVTAANVLVDVSGASGPDATFHPGDEVIVSWDNSGSGDANADVTSVSQVEFDLFGLLMPQASEVVGGVFSYPYIFSSSDPDLEDASASVTVVDDAGNVTGPVTSPQTVRFSSSPPPGIPSLPLPVLVGLAALLVGTALRGLRAASTSG